MGADRTPATKGKATEEALRFLNSLPESKLKELGIQMDKKIIWREAWRPVGSRIAHFHRNWKQISSDHWLLDTVSRYRVEFDGHPPQGRAPMRMKLDAQKIKAMT